MSRYFFIFFILVRPVMDLFIDIEIFKNVNFNVAINLFLILICGIAVIKNINLIRKNKFILTFNKIFIVFFIFSTFSLINTKNYIISISDLFRLITLIISFDYVFIFFQEEKKCLLLLKCLIFSSIIPIGFGLYQFIFNMGLKDNTGFNRIYGTFIHPNVFALYLIMILFLNIFVLSTININIIKKICYAGFSLIVIFEIYETYTRAVWIGLGIGLLIYFLLGKNKVYKKIFYLLLMIFSLFLLSPFILKRWEGSQLDSWVWRIGLWKKVIAETDIKSYFIGKGIGMFQYDVNVMAHNDYLRIFYEIGGLGLICYFLLFFYILRYSIKSVFKSKIVNENNKYRAISCLIIILLVVSFSDNVLRNLGVLMYYFTAMSLLNNFFNPDKKSANWTHI